MYIYKKILKAKRQPITSLHTKLDILLKSRSTMSNAQDLHLHSLLLFFPLGLARVMRGTLRGVFPEGVFDGDRSLRTLEGVTDSPSNLFLTSSSTPSGFSYKMKERKLSLNWKRRKQINKNNEQYCT